MINRKTVENIENKNLVMSKAVAAAFCPCRSGWAAARAWAGGMQMPRVAVGLPV